MKYLLNCRNFISLVVLFSFFDNFGMETEEEDYALRFKVTFVGDAGIGKTTIISRIIDNPFNDAYEPTIGVDFMSKDIRFRDTNIKLQMWDSSGQEKFKDVIPSYVRNSSIVFLIYDISVKSSFDNIPNWISFIKSIENNGNPTLVLCGNKIDLDKREVKKEDGEALAQKEEIAFFEVSAKTGKGIKDMFYSSVADLSIFKECNLDKKNLVKKLLQENENKKEKENGNKNGSVNNDTINLINNDNDNDNFTSPKDTERSSLCSRCIDCCKNCFNSD